MRPDNVAPKILSIGTAVPPHRILQERHYSILETANGMSREEKLRLKKIYLHSGIESRHSVLAEFGEEDRPENVLFHPRAHGPEATVSARMSLFEKHGIELLEKAALNCLAQLPALSTKSITHVVTFSCTGMSAPGLDIQLVERLKLSRSVERTCVNFMGCYAAINALKVAYYITRSDPGAVVLVGGVELCTLHYQETRSTDKAVGNALFADGAAACIVSSKNFGAGTNTFALKNFYAEFEPAGSQEMVWRIGDFGFDLRLGVYVPEFIRENIRALADKLFARAGLQPGEIDLYAIHPGGRRILEACEKALGLAREQNEHAYTVLKKYGNMSSVTILFVLREYLNNLDRKDAGKKIMASAFGPGLTMESFIAEIN
jgi:alpha-pyrone synthase